MKGLLGFYYYEEIKILNIVIEIEIAIQGSYSYIELFTLNLQSE